MIAIDSLRFHYSNSDTGFSLSIPEFRVLPEERVAVIGPSGSGKTTLLNLVAGILVPGQGRVQCAERDISNLTDSDRRDYRITTIGFVFQDFQLIEYLDVLDNVLHPYRITKALELTSGVRKRADDLLQKMGLGDKLKRAVVQLSQGEQQRVAICRALLPSPRLVLADEATGNLDPGNKINILELLFEAASECRSTVLAVTHDYELLPYFDRTVDFNTFLGRGEIER
jgi:putative ABC transport system ATP-binding protein